MPARALAAILIAAAAGLTPQSESARLLVHYSTASEDDPSTSGRLTLTLDANGVKRVGIWEAGCHVAGATDRAPSADADQAWTFDADIVRGRENRPTVRVRYRHLAPTVRATADATRVLALDGTDTLSLNELSAHTDCRYDRIHITLVAEPARTIASRR
jgi:hypothetical protein